MATATSSVASAAAPQTSTTPSSGRPQLKSSNSTSSANNRRSAQSPLDGPQRRNSNKAWQNNSAQQKFNATSMPPSSSSSPTPGQAAGMRARTPGPANGAETDTHDKHMHDRTLNMLAHMLSRNVIVTVKTGAQYSGVLTGSDTKAHDLGAALKWAKLHKSAPGDTEEKEKEGQFVGGGPEKSMMIEAKDLVEIFSEKVPLGDAAAPGPTFQQNGGAFKTDTDISGNIAIRERELLRWQPEESPENGLGLEEQQPAPGQGWNQFEANKRLFGITSEFDEEIYTTSVDRSHPEYQQRAAAAEKIAAELEGQVSASAHVAEERGLNVPDDSGMDEEDKYSGVQRTSAANASTLNKYTPPARRAPSGNPTVPGVPHDPAIISSQLLRPESLQKQQGRHTVAPAVPQQPATEVVSQEDAPAPKPKERSKERPALPAGIPSVVVKSGETAQIEKDLSLNFKNFVSHEKERVKKRKTEMATRDRESKLRELKKFSESFTLKTEVPQDLVPILAKDKQKQAEIVERAKQGVSRAATTSTPTAPANVQSPSTGAQGKQGPKVPPAHSFAAKDPERFQRELKALTENFPRFTTPQQQQQQQQQQQHQHQQQQQQQQQQHHQQQQHQQQQQQHPHPHQHQQQQQQQQQQGFARNVQAMHQDRNRNLRAPMPLPEQTRPPFAPTGPANHGHPGPASQMGHPKRFNAAARPFEYKPTATAFTPTSGGPPANVPTMPASSIPAAPAAISSRAPSPSLFFGSKRPKTKEERPSIKDHFNPFVRMKLAPPKAGSRDVKYGNANDYIEKSFTTSPLWHAEGPHEKSSYIELFGKIEFDPSSVQSGQMQHHMMPPQQHHHQMQPQHMAHMTHAPHVPHQPQHGPVPQQHLGIPPHYEQDHLRQMSSPSSVMPSPSLHHATVAPYQQSPVPHPSQLAMYPGAQGPMNQYGVHNAQGGPGPQYGYYGNNGFRGAQGGAPMMVPGPQGPVPFQQGQMGGQFVQHHPQMYSPQQHQAYLHSGPPPPTSQGFPSPGRPTAPMMMHQGSSQSNAGGSPMVPYGMQPNQSGPVYGAQTQQQSEFPQPGQNWLPQRSQSTVPFSSSAVSSPRVRHKPVPVQSSVPVVPGTPMLSPALAAFASPTLAPAQGYSSQPLQRSQTSNKALDVGDGGRGNGRGRGGGGRGGYHGNGRGRGNMNPQMHPGRPHDGGFYMEHSYSNDPSMNTVGMMRGQPPPPHQGGPPPPPPQFFHGPQGHYPQQAGRGYGGPHQQQHGMPHPPPPPPQQQMQPPPPPPPQQAQAPPPPAPAPEAESK